MASSLHHPTKLDRFASRPPTGWLEFPVSPEILEGFAMCTAAVPCTGGVFARNAAQKLTDVTRG